MGGQGHLTCLGDGRPTFSYGCPVPLDQEYGGLQGPDIRSCSPRGLWCGRLVLTAHIRQIVFFGPGPYPRFPSALVLVLLVRFTQDRHSSLWWCCIDVPKALELLTQRSSLERKRSITTVTSVPWRGNECCVPGHISFVPVSDLLRLLS